MKITDADVLHAAALAKIELDADEVRKFRSELDAVLNYMDMLSHVDTTDVQPTHHPLPIVNAMRDDEDTGCRGSAEVLMSAPRHKDGFIVVPKVIE
jgi:aspartyl-tRNA(Asn)/glutamyl-tRNA(Gln) amidotransferase subunit C